MGNCRHGHLTVHFMTMALIILTQQKEKQTWFDFLHIMILDEKNVSWDHIKTIYLTNILLFKLY